MHSPLRTCPRRAWARPSSLRTSLRVLVVRLVLRITVFGPSRVTARAMVLAQEPGPRRALGAGRMMGRWTGRERPSRPTVNMRNRLGRTR